MGFQQRKYMLMKLHYSFLVVVASLSTAAPINEVDHKLPSDTDSVYHEQYANDGQIHGDGNRLLRTHEADKHDDEGNSFDEERTGLEKVANKVDEAINVFKSSHNLHGLTNGSVLRRHIWQVIL
ncbi:Putative RxLR effector [Phytophthora palmivora]|uniref:RxLR effector protein n=1 Tax=Phytophthora palmivora TaxID=4796 RepID=A0A2P4XRQ1_9STRA|nr:Putative RxLR effector [Phytophthora palmivora]